MGFDLGELHRWPRVARGGEGDHVEKGSCEDLWTLSVMAPVVSLPCKDVAALIRYSPVFGFVRVMLPTCADKGTLRDLASICLFR